MKNEGSNPFWITRQTVRISQTVGSERKHRNSKLFDILGNMGLQLNVGQSTWFATRRLWDRTPSAPHNLLRDRMYQGWRQTLAMFVWWVQFPSAPHSSMKKLDIFTDKAYQRNHKSSLLVRFQPTVRCRVLRFYISLKLFIVEKEKSKMRLQFSRLEYILGMDEVVSSMLTFRSKIITCR